MNNKTFCWLLSISEYSLMWLKGAVGLGGGLRSTECPSSVGTVLSRLINIMAKTTRIRPNLFNKYQYQFIAVSIHYYLSQIKQEYIIHPDNIYVLYSSICITNDSVFHRKMPWSVVQQHASPAL